MAFAPRLKKFVRPLVPDRVMARYRLAQHSVGTRVNVDVLVTDPRRARRWLGTTPDTYRVRRNTADLTAPREANLLTGKVHVSPEMRDVALRFLGDPTIDAVVVGETTVPRLVGRRRAEPRIGPVLIASRPGVLDEIGERIGTATELTGVLARLRDAGFHLGLVPIVPNSAPTTRTDPIDIETMVILSAVPMHDIGGGSRSAQLAVEFLRQGFHVVFVSMYQAQETVDLGLRFIHPDLEQIMAAEFEPANIAKRAGKPGFAVVEAPAAPLIDVGRRLKNQGWALIYDVIDDWSDPALGGEWYRRELEDSLIEEADRLVASAPDLVNRVKTMGRDATLISNGVNAEIFGVDLPPRPTDLPEAETVIGYHGSLYGDWFDWPSLREVAAAYPDAAVILIGDDKVNHPAMPDNVSFLGLKAQTDLPGYVQRFDVGILPFRVTETTHAVSPLKVYEYLASGVPVAAPPLRSLEGLEGVSTGNELVATIAATLDSVRPNRARALHLHGWAQRARSFALAEQPDTTDPRTNVTVRKRPTVHWPAGHRLID
ncbi:MAG: hypothetical protein WBM90_09650 [Acidimicrobiia bacterium]